MAPYPQKYSSSSGIHKLLSSQHFTFPIGKLLIVSVAAFWLLEKISKPQISTLEQSLYDYLLYPGIIHKQCNGIHPNTIAIFSHTEYF